MKNTVQKMGVVMVTAFTAVEYAADILAEGITDVSDHSSFSSTQEAADAVASAESGEMDYQNAVKEAENRKNLLDSSEKEYMDARNEREQAEKILQDKKDEILNTFEEKVRTAQDAVTQAEEAEAGAEKEEKQAEEAVKKAQQEYETADQNYHDLLSDIHISSSDIESGEENLQKLESRQKDLSIRMSQNQAELSDAQTELTNLTISCSEIYVSFQSASDTYNAAQQRYDRESESLQNAVAEADSARKTFDENHQGFTDTSSDLSSKLEYARKVLEDLKGNKNQTEVYDLVLKQQETVDNLQKRYDLAIEREKLEQAYTDAKTQYDDLCSSLQKAKNSFDTASSDYEAVLQKFQDCRAFVESLIEDIYSLQSDIENSQNEMANRKEELETMKRLYELHQESVDSGVALMQMRSVTNYRDLYDEILSAEKRKEDAASSLREADENLNEKKAALENAERNLQNAVQDLKYAQDRYEKARQSVLKRDEDDLTDSDFSCLNTYLQAVRSARKKESSLRAVYEQARMDYDIAIGKISEGSDLYRKHMAYVNARKAYQKLLKSETSDTDGSETAEIRKPAVDTSVKERQDRSTGVFIVSSVIFVSCSLLVWKNRRNRKV